MSQAYSDPARDALPDVEVFELTAEEVAATDEDMVWEYSQRHEFRLCHFNGRDRERMLDAMIEDNGISGGWFWQSCFPGCLPDGLPVGPFATHREALSDSQADAIGGQS